MASGSLFSLTTAALPPLRSGGKIEDHGDLVVDTLPEPAIRRLRVESDCDKDGVGEGVRSGRRTRSETGLILRRNTKAQARAQLIQKSLNNFLRERRPVHAPNNGG